MKRIIFTIVIISGVLHAKAQTFTYKIPGYQNPLVKIDNSWRDRFKLKADSFIKIKPLVRLNTNTLLVFDNMPIAKLPVNSKMPVVQTDVTGYTMPVVGMSLPRVYTMKQTEANKITVP